MNPDYVGDINSLSSIVDKKFDITVCFEVLEHIEFTDVSNAISELRKVTKNYVIISVPQTRLYVSLAFKFPTKHIARSMVSLPMPLKHKFNGEHYWELGKKNFSRRKFRSILDNNFATYSEYTDPLNPYHRFFICKI